MKNNQLDGMDSGLSQQQLIDLRSSVIRPPSGAWRRVQKGLHRKKRLIFFYRAAAALVLLGVMIGFFIEATRTDPSSLQRAEVSSDTPAVVPELSDLDENPDRGAKPTRKENEPVASKPVQAPATAAIVAIKPAEIAEPESQQELQIFPESEQLVSADISDKSIDIESDSEATGSTEAPITLVYELTLPAEPEPQRPGTAARIIGFAADLKSGEASIGLFRSIRQVIVEPARRHFGQNSNLR